MSKLSFLIVIVLLLAACGMEAEITPTTTSPTVAVTPTATSPSLTATPTMVIETATAVATPTQPLPTLIPPTAIPLLCLPDTPLPAQSTAQLRVTYQLEGQEWVWKEETGVAEPVSTLVVSLPSVPEEAVDWITYPDQVAYLLQTDTYMYELWLGDTNGQNRRQLSTITIEDVATRFPWATSSTITLWVSADGRSVIYILSPAGEGLGNAPIDSVGVVDIDTGQKRMLFAKVDNLYAIQQTSDGKFILALLPDEVRFVEIATGQATSLALPLSTYGPDSPILISPDKQKMVLFANNQLTIIDLATLKFKLIPFSYAVIGAGHYVIYPTVVWHDDGVTFSTLISDVPKPYLDFGDVFKNDALFSVWQVNIDTLTTEKQNSFEGNIINSALSPNGRYLLFMHQIGNRSQLFVADVQTGEYGLYDAGMELNPRIGWSPDSSRFLYSGRDTYPLLGQLCQPPRPLTYLAQQDYHPMLWVDGQRLLYFEGNMEEEESNILFLINVEDGTRTAVATLDPNAPYFNFYFE